ncbi:splicing factor ESS-2 homolog [Anabrus simplex]|uniref:splicing factor ESS-2 homolog n=1 Tax=Anabrus simplex TaxID=316456 RepID=UPI0035A30ADD
MPEEICSAPRPGERALQMMKVVKEVDIFKTPVCPAVKAKSKTKKVLDEDAYLQEMGKIIQRDFFPDLEKLKAQNEYLEAIERNDAQKLRELYLKYSSGKRPPTERYASPATFETPMDVRREEEEQQPQTNASLPEVADKEPGSSSSKLDSSDENKPNNSEEPRQSLDEYLSSHTSEDNQSFQEIMHEADLKHRQKFAWLYKEEENSGERKKEMLALPSIEEQASDDKRPLMVDTWGYRNKNYIMYVPDGVSLTPEEKVEMASRRQSIAHCNTRLTQNPFDERQNKETIHQLAQSQAHNLEGKIGVDGKELTLSSTPKVNGYSFVKTPSPAPGVNESPLMTWGEIEGTPFRLDGGDTPVRTTPGPSFRIPEPPKREKLALALAEKVGERHRDRKLKAIEAARKQLASPSPRPGSLERLNTMSPAAQRLASTQLRRLGSDRALQASYSPSPRGRHSVNTPITPKTPGRTPTPRSKVAQSVRRTPNPNLTDNLLNLPKRPRAADFFDK